jgi:hypothetical protein
MSNLGTYAAIAVNSAHNGFVLQEDVRTGYAQQGLQTYLTAEVSYDDVLMARDIARYTGSGQDCSVIP